MLYTLLHTECDQLTSRVSTSPFFLINVVDLVHTASSRLDTGHQTDRQTDIRRDGLKERSDTLCVSNRYGAARSHSPVWDIGPTDL